VKIFPALATLIVAFAGLLAAETFAQGTGSAAAPRSASGSTVAVIDIGHIFRNFDRFKQAMDDLKTDFETTQKHFQNQQNEINNQRELLRDFRPGTADYRRKEEEITRKLADLQAEMALAKKDFREREARIFYDHYDEIVAQVEKQSRRFGLLLVLRYNGEPIRAEDPASVMQGVNRAVVWQGGIDITNYVLDALTPPKTNPPAGGSASRYPNPHR